MLATQGTHSDAFTFTEPEPEPELIAKLTPSPCRSQRIRRGHHRQITSPCGLDWWCIRVRASSSPYPSDQARHHAHRLSFLPGSPPRPPQVPNQISRRALHHHNHFLLIIVASILTESTTRARTHKPAGLCFALAPPWVLGFSRRRHAAGGLGAGGPAPGRREAVGARDEPRGAGRGGGVGQGAGDRAEAGGDARHAARPPRGRVRALAHRPRRQDRRGRGQQLCGAAADREERGEPEPLGSGRAVRVRRPGRAAAGEDDGEAGLREAAWGRRQREREQPPQQQRRRPAQLVHAPLLHPQLHRTAPRPRPLLLQLRPGRQRRRPRRLQQEGERRRHGQVLAAAVGPAVAEVEPAAARPQRRSVRRAVGDADGGEPLRSGGQSLKTFLLAEQWYLPRRKRRQIYQPLLDVHVFAVLYIRTSRNTVWLFSLYEYGI